MKIEIKETINKNRWTAYHSEWGVAKGRMSTLLWDSKKEVEDWIKEQNVWNGFYTPIPLILPQDLVNAIIINE